MSQFWHSAGAFMDARYFRKTIKEGGHRVTRFRVRINECILKEGSQSFLC
jgi:hypothetical protein